MKDVFIGQVGIWGQRHYQCLKENKPTTVNVMRMNGTLKQYLREVDEQAEKMLYGLVRQMAKDEGVNEALKRQDHFERVKKKRLPLLTPTDDYANNDKNIKAMHSVGRSPHSGGFAVIVVCATQEQKRLPLRGVSHTAVSR